MAKRARSSTVEAMLPAALKPVTHLDHRRKVHRLPVWKGRLAGQAARVAQELTYRELDTPVRRFTRDLEPRQVLGDGIVELQRARVPKAHDRRGCEELGDRADPVDRGGSGRDMPLHVGLPERARPEQPLIVYDGHGQARERPVGEPVFDPCHEEIERRAKFRMLDAHSRRRAHRYASPMCLRITRASALSGRSSSATIEKWSRPAASTMSTGAPSARHAAARSWVWRWYSDPSSAPTASTSGARPVGFRCTGLLRRADSGASASTSLR